MAENTATRVRKPAFAYYEVRPDGDLARTAWAIERQLSLAADYDEHALIDVLLAMNPTLDESIAAEISYLLDLAEQVDSAYVLASSFPADESWPVVRDNVVDEYVEQLRRVAKLVRGLPVGATRPRHVLGAKS